MIANPPKRLAEERHIRRIRNIKICKYLYVSSEEVLYFENFSLYLQQKRDYEDIKVQIAQRFCKETSRFRRRTHALGRIC